jgi:hypothetical protein
MSDVHLQMRPFHEGLGSHHLCYSIDLKSVRFTQIPAAISKIYLKYSYRYFGTSAQVVTAPVEVVAYNFAITSKLVIK